MAPVMALTRRFCSDSSPRDGGGEEAKRWADTGDSDAIRRKKKKKKKKKWRRRKNAPKVSLNLPP